VGDPREGAQRLQFHEQRLVDIQNCPHDVLWYPESHLMSAAAAESRDPAWRPYPRSLARRVQALAVLYGR
jgi:hypothetical protein